MNYLSHDDYLGKQPTPSDLYHPGPERRAELTAMGYHAYLQTAEWRELRRLHISIAEHRCDRCRRRGVPLELHHRSYERLGHEWPEDLEVLCRDCHAAHHEKAA